MTSISVRKARKAYGAEPVLDDVDFAVDDGRIAALLGPSGCGKTTLLRLIAGFERLDRGEIAIGGRLVADARSHMPPERRRVGYVPQEGALFPHLTVAGNVGFGLGRRERSGGRLAEALELVGVAGLAGRYPHELSGGQQQRVALARALAPRPDLVLLDEPFSGLDLDLRRALSADVVRTLRKAGASAILVTHDPEEAFASADVIAVMAGGRIVQQGDPLAVYSAPASPAVARITGPAIFLDAVVGRRFAETVLGALPVAPFSEPVSGPAQICLRPGQIVLAATGREGRVVATSFRGEHTSLTVAIGDCELPARAPAGFAAAPDDIVRVAVAGECIAFPRASAS